MKEPLIIVNNTVGYTPDGSDVIIYKNNSSSSWEKAKLGSGLTRMRLQADELKVIFEGVYNLNINELCKEG